MAVRASRDLAWPDLVWSHFSRPRFDDIDARIEAAAAHGFAAIGLYLDAWRQVRAGGRTVADLARVLERYEICVAEMEAVRGWWAVDGPDREACAASEEAAFELADALEVRYLQAIGPYDCGIDQAAAGLAGLCDRAAEHGLLVGVEWLPFTNIVSAADAAELIRMVDRPNAGYCVDIWHHVRGANDLSMIEALEPHRIFAVQMNDGTVTPALPDYKADCLATRLPPGAGEFDCVGFTRRLFELGVTAPISLEVCSEALWAAPVRESARLAADGMRGVLAGLAGSR